MEHADADLFRCHGVDNGQISSLRPKSISQPSPEDQSGDHSNKPDPDSGSEPTRRSCEFSSDGVLVRKSSTAMAAGAAESHKSTSSLDRQQQVPFRKL